MSVTATERANPPPRRKSCAACTRAKRRCDLASPSCQRCTGRGLQCHYPQRRGPADLSVPAPTPTPSFEDAREPAVDFTIDALMDGFWSSSDACAVDPLPLPDFSVPTVEMPSESPPASAHSGPPATFDPQSLLRGQDKQLVYMGSVSGRLATADDVVCTPQFLSDRLGYLFDYMHKLPQVLVDTLGTPWCHPTVFKEVTPKAYEGESILRVL